MELSLEERNAIKHAVVNNFDSSEVNIRESYSGRCMYGKECFGFSIGKYENPSKIIRKIALEVEEEGFEELAEKLYDFSEDSMGLGAIVYYPSIEWGAEEKASLKYD